MFGGWGEMCFESLFDIEMYGLSGSRQNWGVHDHVE